MEQSSLRTFDGVGSDGDGEEIGVLKVNYTVESDDEGPRPVVHVFGRTRDGEARHVRVTGFRPYFYAPSEEVGGTEDERITGTDEGYESIESDDLTRLYTRIPADVGEVRDSYTHYEADILFPNRFRIDKGVKSGLRVGSSGDTDIEIDADEVEPCDADSPARTCVLDIEVDDRRGFPEEGEEPIICIAVWDSFDDEYRMFVWDIDEDEVGDDRDYVLQAYDEEEAMLDGFLEYLNDRDPDVLTGWNSNDFDLPYLIDRLEALEMDATRLSRVGQVWHDDWGGPTIKGRATFDLLYGYQRMKFTELESYRLDAIAEEELGESKVTYTGKIGDLWEDDPDKLLEYNKMDVELCVRIDEKVGVIDFFRELARFVGCSLEDATTPSDVVDVYVLRKAHGKFVLPSKGGASGGEEYEGGEVFEPITGIRENVAVLDLASLYPMSMVTVNASPETKVSDGYDGETYDVEMPDGSEIRFRKEPEGLTKSIVTELLEERDKKKAARDRHEMDSEEYEKYDNQQNAIKVVMNSYYGVAGYPRFRLYDREMGSAVTATGRAVIEHTKEVVEDEGHEVVYGDSVTGDRPVVLRDPDGRIRVRPIEAVFQVAESRSTVAADGGKEYRYLEGWDALSVNDDGEAEWKPVEGVMRHRTEKPVVRLRHKFGESTTTRDHSYVVEEGDSLVKRKPEEIEEPLRVPSIPEVNEVGIVDVYEVLTGYERDYTDSRGNGEPRQKTKRVHADDGYVWFGHEKDGEKDSTVKVQRFVEVGTDDCKALLRLLGVYVADGSASTEETSSRKFGASIASSDREKLDMLRRDYERLFENAKAPVTESSKSERTVSYETQNGVSSVTYDGTTQKLQMMNELSAVFFREFAGQRSRGKRIPDFVYHLPTEEQTIFLEALVGGDGSREFPRYSDEYAERNFDFETTSREVAAGLSLLLTQRGKKHSFKYREDKGSYTVRTCDYYREGRSPVVKQVGHDGYVYDLSVSDNQNFVDGVGGLVLHNTDSTLVELGDGSLDELIERGVGLEETINASYDPFAREEFNAETHRWDIEFEKLYRRFFQAGRKKRYAGHLVWKEGKEVDDVDITGFEYKRSDVSQVTKEVQQEVIEMILDGAGFDEVSEYIQDVVARFKDGEFGYDEVGVPGGIGQKLESYDTDTAQVTGAKYANEHLGTNFTSGSKPKRLYVKRVKGDLPPTDVVCFEYAEQIPEEIEVDWDKMMEKTVRKPIERILEALGWSWSEVVTGQRQQGLGSFT